MDGLRPAPAGWPRLRRLTRNAIFRVWARICLRIVGGRVRVEGKPPRAPFLLVCNHLGYVDILVLAACTDAWFVAKMEMCSWPLVGMLCPSVGTIFIDRQLGRDVLRVNRLIENVLADGYGVVIFPEGTSTQGFDVRRFRTSLLDHPARSGMPVHVAALTYRTGVRRAAGAPLGLLVGRRSPLRARANAYSSRGASTSSSASVPRPSAAATERNWPPTCTARWSASSSRSSHRTSVPWRPVSDL